MNTIKELIENYTTEALKTVKDYINDVIVHDVEDIAMECIPGNTGKIFFFLRETGSHAVTLTKKCVESLPKKGERVPFLFGTSNREGIYNSLLDIIEYNKKNRPEGKVFCIDVAKKTLKKSSYDEAESFFFDTKRSYAI